MRGVPPKGQWGGETITPEGKKLYSHFLQDFIALQPLELPPLLLHAQTMCSHTQTRPVHRHNVMSTLVPKESDTGPQEFILFLPSHGKSQ